MKRKIAIFMTGLCLHAGAQNQDDIYRFSHQNLSGSARTLGLAGAWGAAGADLSSASLNPAGLALYRRNELMGSMAVMVNRSNTEFNGNPMSDSRTMFNIPNLGMVFNFTDQYMGRPQTKGIVGGSLAFGMNRLNDYQSNTQYSGTVKNSSVGDFLAKQAKGKNYANLFDSYYDNDLFAQAWRVALIDTVKGSATDYVSIQQQNGDTNYSMRQFQQIQTRGRMNEWYAGGGLNVGNFLYLGGTLVIQHAVYEKDNSYQEKMLSSSLANNPYESVQLEEHIETRGTGVGGKFGVILRPVSFLRLGASYHTPVRLNMRDDYMNATLMTYSNGNSYEAPNPNDARWDYYKYQIVTPSRVSLNGAFLLGKILMITADYERVDFSKGKLQTKDGTNDFYDANQSNRMAYGVAENYKGGIEVCGRYTRFRAGYALLGSPYKDSYISKEDGLKQVVSAGFGWIYDNAYFFDLAVSDCIGKEYHTPYEGAPVNAVNSTHKLNFVFGAGYRF